MITPHFDTEAKRQPVIKQIIIRIKNKLHTHKWETTHTNKWQIPTRQRCKCGLERKEKSCNLLKYYWVYSDGTKSKQFKLGDGIDE